MEEDEDVLNSLLAVATEQLDKLEEDQNIEALSGNKHSNNTKAKTSKEGILKEVDIFQFEKLAKSHNSTIHNGDTDSSDDEGNRNYEEQKYSEYGREIKRLLNTNEDSHSISSSHYGVPKKRVSSWKTNPNKSKPAAKSSSLTKPNNEQPTTFKDVLLDPIFGMRIVNPKVSSAMLMEKMQGRLAVSFADLTKQIFGDNLKDKDWVICGVVVNKSPPKTSQKGNEYSIWTLSDLKHDIKTVALFMFGSAHKDLWKTMVGTVVGVLNPSVMERREGSKDEAALSIDSSQKVMVFGQSKDFGTCKSTKKNGEKCTAIVNLGQCEYCIYHIKQEYQKCSKRSELQANFAGKGLVNLRNKVLGKNEVFYAGKSYMAVPAKKSKKLEARDSNILETLNGKTRRTVKTKTIKKKGVARHLDIDPAQRARDLELLKKLGGTSIENKTNFSGTRSEEVSLQDSKATAISVINKLKAKKGSLDNKIASKSSQYDLKGDLFVNVDNKSSFSGKLSENVTLEESKNNALSVISKLKGGRTDLQLKGENNDEVPLEALELSGDKLEYSDNSNACNLLDEVPQQTNAQSPKIVHNNTKSLVPATTTPKNSLHKKTSILDKITLGIPMLSGSLKEDLIDLNKPIMRKHVARAKTNALKYIQRNGPIKKIDPNSTRASGTKKRSINGVLQGDISNTIDEENPAKKSKLQESEFISDRFKKMMAMTSKHANLLEVHDNAEKEKYFNKLEIKERMEEKMTNTHKVKCKAVKCLQCKYTSFSASDLCKSERHTLKVFDAMKRFYKCSNCQNRTVTLELIPTRPCNNCGSSKWEKTGMMKEKIALVQHNLSIRGGEQKFVNSVATDASLDLLVPDDQ